MGERGGDPLNMRESVGVVAPPDPPHPVATPAFRRRVALGGAALLAYVGMAFALFGSTWRHPTTTWVGGGGPDNVQMMWFLGWTARAIGHGQMPFLSGYLNVPLGVNMMWNVSMFFAGVVLAPFIRLTGPILAFNILTTLAPAVSAWCAYLAGTHFTGNRWAGAAAGIVYGFSPFVMLHSMGHPYVTLLFTPPLVLVLLDEILARRRHRPALLGVGLGALVITQLFISEEVLALEAIAAAVGIATLAVIHRRGMRGRIAPIARAFGCAGLVVAALAAWPLWVQFHGPQSVHGEIHVGTAGSFSADAADFVLPTAYQAIGPNPGKAGPPSGLENGAYFGVPLLLLAAIGAIAFRSKGVVRALLAAGAAGLVLMFGPRLRVHGHILLGWMPGRVVEALPILRNLIPQRAVIIVDLVAAMLLAFFVAWVAGGSRIRTLAGAAGLALVVVTLFPRVPFASTDAPATPAFFTTAAVDAIPDGSVAVVLPIAGSRDVRSMLWQARAGFRFRMPGGYFIGPGPHGGAAFGPATDTFFGRVLRRVQSGGAVTLDASTRAHLDQDLRQWDAKTIVVGPITRRDAVVAFLSAYLRAAPETVGGVALWRI